MSAVAFASVISLPLQMCRNKGPSRLIRALLCWMMGLSLACGCAFGGGAGGESPGTEARVIYEAGGELAGVSMDDLGKGTGALVWERAPGNKDKTGQREAGVSLVLVDVVSGHARVLHRGVAKWSSFEPYSFWVDLSPEGKCVAAALTDDPAEPGSSVWVSDDFHTWRKVTPTDGKSRTMVRWSPDGRKLAFLVVDTSAHSGRLPSRAWVVALSPSLAPKTRVCVSPGEGRVIDIAWARDGSRLYLVVEKPGDRGEKCLLETVEWPTLKKTVIAGAPEMGLVSVAAGTGEVVWLARGGSEGEGERPRGEEPWALWEARPGGAAHKTPVTIDFTPSFLHAVSPDGRWWAVSPRISGDRLGRRGGRGLVVYSVADGSAYRWPALAAREIIGLAWARGGKVLVVAERGKRLWAVPMPKAD